MRKTLLVIALIAVAASAYFVMSLEPVLGQPLNIQSVLGNNMKFLNPAKGFLPSVPTVAVDKVIQVGSNFVAFNPNHGDSKVITVLSP